MLTQPDSGREMGWVPLSHTSSYGCVIIFQAIQGTICLQVLYIYIYNIGGYPPDTSLRKLCLEQPVKAKYSYGCVIASPGFRICFKHS